MTVLRHCEEQSDAAIQIKTQETEEREKDAAQTSMRTCEYALILSISLDISPEAVDFLTKCAHSTHFRRKRHEKNDCLFQR